MPDRSTTNWTSTGTPVARYLQGLNIDEPLAMLRSSATSYYEADGLGSITSLSNSSGSIVNTYSYNSFGNLTASTGSVVNPFLFTAREYDESGLYFYRARYYDANTGRFLNEDLIRFSGGQNFYRYTGNNAPNFTDPYGLLQACCRPAQSVHGIACHCFLLLSDGHTLGGYFKPPPFLHPKRDDPDDNIGKKKQPGTFCNKIPASKCDENRLNKAFDDLPWMIYLLNGTSNSVPGDLLRTTGIDSKLPPCAWARDFVLPHKSDPWPPPEIGEKPLNYK